MKTASKKHFTRIKQLFIQGSYLKTYMKIYNIEYTLIALFSSDNCEHFNVTTQ